MRTRQAETEAFAKTKENRTHKLTVDWRRCQTRCNCTLRPISVFVLFLDRWDLRCHLICANRRGFRCERNYFGHWTPTPRLPHTNTNEFHRFFLLVACATMKNPYGIPPTTTTTTTKTTAMETIPEYFARNVRRVNDRHDRPTIPKIEVKFTDFTWSKSSQSWANPFFYCNLLNRNNFADTTKSMMLYSGRHYFTTTAPTGVTVAERRRKIRLERDNRTQHSGGRVSVWVRLACLWTPMLCRSRMEITYSDERATNSHTNEALAHRHIRSGVFMALCGRIWRNAEIRAVSVCGGDGKADRCRCSWLFTLAYDGHGRAIAFGRHVCERTHS